MLLIRHGQSQNNVIAGEAQVRLDRGEVYDEVFERVAEEKCLSG